MNKTSAFAMRMVTGCSIAVAAACSGSDVPETAELHSEVTRGPDAMSFNQGWRVDQHVRVVRDITGDRRADLIGFGDQGVYVAKTTSNGLSSPTVVIANLGNSQGWTNANTIRTLADVNGDGLLDIVGFGQATVQVALNNAETGFSALTTWTNDYTSEKGWKTTTHARFVGDVDGDRKADIIGISDWGVYVSRTTGTGSTLSAGPQTFWLNAFSQTQRWDAAKHLRMAADVDHDGLTDLVGFGEDGVYLAKSNGSTFGAVTKVSPSFGYNEGWRISSHIRMLANVNGDKFLDIVGFGPNGVIVALGNASGFSATTPWSNDFGDSTGWTTDKHVRLVGDVDGDGLDDIVGINDDHVYVARSTGAKFDTPIATLDDFTYARGWRVDKHPRMLADVNGDGQLDLIGFSNDSIYWERLTPEPVIPTDWDTPACAASRLRESSPGYCEGPWRYTTADRCVSRDPSCQRVCTGFKSCPKWENGCHKSDHDGIDRCRWQRRPEVFKDLQDRRLQRSRLQRDDHPADCRMPDRCLDPFDSTQERH